MALPNTAVWEVRSAGNATNGGFFNAARGGTDYSQSDTPILSVADGDTSGGANLNSSGEGGFTADMVGNGISVTTSGTTLWYEIVTFTDTNNVQLDRAVGALSGSSLVRVGGAVTHPGIAAGLMVAGNKVWVKAATYTCNATANLAGGRINLTLGGNGGNPLWIVGYNATRGDISTRPVLQASANAVTVLTTSGDGVIVENLDLDGNKASFTGTPFNASSTSNRTTVRRCIARNSTARGFNGTAFLLNCEAISNTTDGFGTGGVMWNCESHGNGAAGFSVQNAVNSSTLVNCYAWGNTGTGFGTSYTLNAINCTSYGNASGFDFTPPGAFYLPFQLTNCIAYANTGLGYKTSSATNGVQLLNCAGGNNSSGNFTGAQLPSVVGFVALSADPFVNAASHNFALNNTAGGGAALRQLGYGSNPSGSTTSYPDIGAADHQEAASGGGPSIGSKRIKFRRAA